MPFRFPLAAVLRIRENAEEREERALQTIQLEIARLLNEVEEMNAELARVQEARDQELKRPVAAGHLHALQGTAHAIKERKSSLLRHLLDLQQRREHQIKVYQAAHRDREMLTGMLEKQRDAYQQHWDRREQKNLDDIFSSRRSRN